MSQQEQIQAIKALAEKLGVAALEQGRHEIALNALLSAYVAMAATFPCCTRAASASLYSGSMALAAAASTGPHHPGQHIH